MMVDGGNSSSGVFSVPGTYDEEEDYDSDLEAGLGNSLAERTKNKLLTLIHSAHVDLDDQDGSWVIEPTYDILTANPTLDDLQGFCTECEEVLVWSKQSRRVEESDVATWCCLYREFRKGHGAEERVIGKRTVLELSLLVDTWVFFFRHVFADGLLTDVPARRTRASSAAGLRRGRFAATETTTGEALVQRADQLQTSLAAALAALVAA